MPEYLPGLRAITSNAFAVSSALSISTTFATSNCAMLFSFMLETKRAPRSPFCYFILAGSLSNRNCARRDRHGVQRGDLGVHHTGLIHHGLQRSLVGVGQGAGRSKLRKQV